MLKKTIVFGVVVSLVLTACVVPRLAVKRGSGVMASRDFAIQDFEEVEVQNAFDLKITQGETYKVNVTIDDNLFDSLIVEKVGNRLVIRFDSRQYTSFQTTQAAALVSLPRLSAIEASGANHVQLTDFKETQAMQVNLAGASRMTGLLSAPEFKLDASGASTGSLEGTIPRVNLTLSGASQFDLSRVAANAATAGLSGASSLTLGSLKTLDYHLSGASTLRYQGKPTLGQHEESGGSQAIAIQ